MQKDLNAVQRLANYAVRRCFGMDRLAMQEHHISDGMMYKLSGWGSMEKYIKRMSLTWLGHICRMRVDRAPKVMTFGWIEKVGFKASSAMVQPRFWVRALKQIGIEELDFFRLAQDRNKNVETHETIER